MSKNSIREDKTCLNCGHQVAERFCPNCGQENIESRKTFHHLFIHFFEDLTHYENAFWRTIRNLLLKPAALTSEYLSGKRLSYLAPVRLYIFISFITFFILTVIPRSEPIVEKQRTNSFVIGKDTIVIRDKKKNKKDFQQALGSSSLPADSISKDFTGFHYNKKDNGPFFSLGVNSMKDLDSIQQYGKSEDRYNAFEYWIIKKGIQVNEHNTRAELIEKFKEAFVHNLPKALFVYMPLFAFFLWLFQNKKRWYYFDHGIFTLHYFSFLLLMVLINFLFSETLSLFGHSGIVDFINGFFDIASFAWMIYYFFPAHHRFYGETRLISAIKGAFLFIINVILIIIIVLLFAIYTFINIR